MRAKGIVIVSKAAHQCERWLDPAGIPSLLTVGNRPIICHVLDALRAAGVTDLAVLGAPEVLRDISAALDRDGQPGEISYLPCDAGLGAARVARFAADASTILHSSDGLLDQPLRPLLDRLHRDGPPALLLLADGVRHPAPLTPAVSHATRLAQLPRRHASLGLAGVCLLAPNALRDLSAAPDPLAPLSVEGMAEHVSSGVRTPGAHLVRAWHRFAGDPLDLLDVNRVALDRLERPKPIRRRSDDIQVEGAVQISPTASIASSVIHGPAVIGAGARIADSYVGPHTSIGERVRLEGSEIEQSIVFAGASIVHIGSRLVSSVVGRGARIFRDFSVPRAIRMQVGDGDEIALC